MRVQVKLIGFPTDKAKWGHSYCSYCPAIEYAFGRGETLQEVIADVQSRLFNLLCHRFLYRNLQVCGWEVTENSVKPPIFADEELIKLTESSYGESISDYKIVEIDVEAPIIPSPQ